MIDFLLTYVFCELVMLLTWAAVIISIAFVAYSTKAWSLLIVATGCFPWFIFFLFRFLGIWDLSKESVLYTRVAGFVLAGTIIYAVFLMRKGRVKDDDFN